MWTMAYATTNLSAVDNPYTPGQCGGMCGVWLANMYNRGAKRSLVETMPKSRVATDTHLAGLRVAPGLWRTNNKVTNIANLPVTAANMRYVAAAGLKPGPVKTALRTNLANWLAQSRASGGYFIDVGGHAVATFVDWKKFQSYEKKRRLCFFDPNHGCYFSENELSFNAKFNELVNEHTGRNRSFNEHYWSYFKVFDVGTTGDDDADIDISSLFD